MYVVFTLFVSLTVHKRFVRISCSSQRKNIIDVISHVTILTGFQFNRFGLENKWTGAIVFFPICRTKTIELGLWRESDVGNWTAIKRMMNRETRVYMSFTTPTIFHTPHVRAKKWETRTGSLPNKNQAWNTFQIINNIIVCIWN